MPVDRSGWRKVKPCKDCGEKFEFKWGHYRCHPCYLEYLQKKAMEAINRPYDAE